MSQDSVRTSQTLTQRSAQSALLVSPEEILRMRTQSFSNSKTEIGFLLRQPAASSILRNYVALELDLQFVLSERLRCSRYIVPANAQAPARARNPIGGMPKYLPIQDSCVRTAVVSINGASQTYRCSEYMREYLALHANREYFEKVGYGVPDYNQLPDPTASEKRDSRTFNEMLTARSRVAYDSQNFNNATSTMIFKAQRCFFEKCAL